MQSTDSMLKINSTNTADLLNALLGRQEPSLAELTIKLNCVNQEIARQYAIIKALDDEERELNGEKVKKPVESNQLTEEEQKKQQVGLLMLFLQNQTISALQQQQLQQFQQDNSLKRPRPNYERPRENRDNNQRPRPNHQRPKENYQRPRENYINKKFCNNERRSSSVSNRG